jgi:DNA-binding transcriptional regulator YiaG
MKDKYKSDALQVIHEDMKDMHQLGIITDDRMKEFDNMCLEQEPKHIYITENAGEKKYPKPWSQAAI